MLQRPERVTLLSAPQAFFGLALNGWILITICVILSVTAWITAIQRIMFVYRATNGAAAPAAEARRPSESSHEGADVAEPATVARAAR